MATPQKDSHQDCSFANFDIALDQRRASAAHATKVRTTRGKQIERFAQVDVMVNVCPENQRDSPNSHNASSRFRPQLRLLELWFSNTSIDSFMSFTFWLKQLCSLWRAAISCTAERTRSRSALSASPVRNLRLARPARSTTRARRGQGPAHSQIQVLMTDPDHRCCRGGSTIRRFVDVLVSAQRTE